MKLSKSLFLLVIVSLLLIAARPLQEADGGFLEELVAYFLTLTGFAAIITFLVNIGKRIGWVTDGNAAVVVKWMNLVALVVVGILYVLIPDAIPVVDKLLGYIAEIGGILVPIVLGLSWVFANKASGGTYTLFRGFPLIGYSYSK